MKRNLLAMSLALAMTASLLSGCGEKPQEGGDQPGGGAADSSANEVIVINYPTFQCGVNTAAPVVDQLISEFNETYAGKYQIKKEEVPGDQNYVDKIKVQLGTGDLPPVVYGGGYNLLDLALAKNVVIDLTDAVSSDPEWKALYTDVAMTTNSRDGKIYASSSEGSLIGYFYNKDLFQQAGISKPAETWEEFWQQCDALKAAGITPLALDTADSAWVTSLWTGALVASQGDSAVDFLRQMTPDNYNTPEMIFAVGQVQKMLEQYTTKDAVGGKYEHAANNFLSEQAAMIANGPWMMSDFSDETKAAPGFADKVGVAIYPGSFVYDAPIQGYFATKQDDPKLEEAAVEMVKFFTSAHAQQVALEVQGMVPASPAVEITEKAKETYPLLAEFLDIAADAKVRTDNMQATMYPNLLDVVSQELPRLSAGEITPEQYCQILTDEAAKNK